MRRPLLGLLLASTLLAETSLPARTAHAEPPPAPLAPYAAPLVGPAWASPLAGTRRRNSGVMALGVVLASLGAIGMAAGTAIDVQAVGGCTQADLRGSFSRSNCDNAGDKLLGMTMLLGSAVTAAVGVPLWIYGAEKVAATPADQAPRPAASLVVGPSKATFEVSF
jgi:hypothetical protein